MSGHGSDDGPLGGRRPAPRRPDTGSSRRPAPPPVEHDDDDSDEKTQALNLDDLARFGAADDATVSMSAAELRARVGQRSQLPPEPEHEESEATVAMQIPGDLMDGGGAKKTILGHPGLARGASSAVRGAAPVKRNETLAMDSRNVRAAAAAAKAAAGDADESTQAMDVNAMLAGIDDGGGGDEATQAMNMDD
ncbi:MAG: hypothetical protein KC635_28625, partial [Myxococcales bacterium]|nr:hypothetical protein [Myxococcales bacterium]